MVGDTRIPRCTDELVTVEDVDHTGTLEECCDEWGPAYEEDQDWLEGEEEEEEEEDDLQGEGPEAPDDGPTAGSARLCTLKVSPVRTITTTSTNPGQIYEYVELLVNEGRRCNEKLVLWFRGPLARCCPAAN